MICVEGLTKRYGSILALDRLSLDVPPGSVFGLLGPNGAGKTTFLRLVMGFLFPDAGQIDRRGLLPAEIGYLPERAFYPSRFSVRDYLFVVAQLIGLGGRARQEAVQRQLARVGLLDVAERRLGDCSRGMLQRVGLAQALLGDPPLLLLDEPALGLDPTAQKFMREQISALRHTGKTVILSSHHLDEVARVCSHVAVLNQGRLMRSGPLEAILSPKPEVRILAGSLPADLAEALLTLAPDISVAQGEVVLAGSAVSHKTRVLRMLLDAGVEVRQLTEQRATLEDVYLQATDQ